MSKNAPPRVDDIERYWNDAPHERSARCMFWIDRIKAGWRPNRRVRSMGYYALAEYLGVYIWELIFLISPFLRGEIKL